MRIRVSRALCSLALLLTACSHQVEPSVEATTEPEPAWMEDPCVVDTTDWYGWTKYDLRTVSLRVPREFRRQAPRIPDVINMREGNSYLRVSLGADPSYGFQYSLRMKDHLRVCEGEIGGFIVHAMTYRNGRTWVFVAYWPAPLYVDGRHRWIYATITTPYPAKMTILRQALLTIQIPQALAPED